MLVDVGRSFEQNGVCSARSVCLCVCVRLCVCVQWCPVLPHLAEMEYLLLQTSDDGSESGTSSIQTDAAEDLPANLSYLVYDCNKQKLSGNVLHPCRAEEHSFCERALSVHDELRHSPELISKTFSSQDYVFSGVQHGHRQLFYELPRTHRADTTALNITAVNHLLSNS